MSTTNDSSDLAERIEQEGVLLSSGTTFRIGETGREKVDTKRYDLGGQQFEIEDVYSFGWGYHPRGELYAASLRY